MTRLPYVKASGPGFVFLDAEAAVEVAHALDAEVLRRRRAGEPIGERLMAFAMAAGQLAADHDEARAELGRLRALAADAFAVDGNGGLADRRQSPTMPLMTATQVHHATGIPARSVRYAAKAGALAAVETDPYRFRPSDVDAWAATKGPCR